MALDKKTFPISFSQGVDTKTDPKQVAAGKFINLENVKFGTQGAFTKRNGNILLGTVSDQGGAGLGTFKNELVAFDGASAYSYNPATETYVNKGPVRGVELDVSSVYRASTGQTEQDSAYNTIGKVYLFVWKDSQAGCQYIVVSAETGQQVIPVQTLNSNAVSVRAWSISRHLIVTYINSATNQLLYIAIPAINPGSPADPDDISTVVDASFPTYDGTVLGDTLYLGWNGSDGSGAVRVSYLDANLNQGGTVVLATQNADHGISIFSDSSYPLPNIWIAYCNGSAIKYSVLTSISLSEYLAPTVAVSGVSTTQQLTGYANNGMGTLYYQISHTYGYSSVRTDIIYRAYLSDAGVAGSPAVFQRGAGIISKVFGYADSTFLVIAFGESLQPTYFVLDNTANVISKVAYTNGGGYGSAGLITNVNQIDTAQFQFAYLFKSLLETQSGTVFTQTGVNSVVIDFASQNLYQSTEIGKSMNINGGFLWMYDGYGPVEQNFHLYPETLGATGATGGSIASGNYSYISLYEWTDNQGNLHRSGYGTPFPVTLASSGKINLSLPTLRVTAKKAPRTDVSIAVYRTTATATNVYYRVSSLTSPTLNSTTVDAVAFSDTSSDASIVGNELLYTTGGVVQNSGGPSAVSLNIFRNRLMLIDSEDRNQLWYSKQVLAATPVEMSQEFTQYIDPRFGPMYALAVLDDKEIIFKENAIFYITGDGPDSTGSQNTFSDATFITSVVGTTNPKSIALTPDGLMFQSTTKGIWLLNRSLTVSYIGAPVERYNEDRVTSAQLIPNSTQVRFTTVSGIALVYDYYYQQWATYSNHDAVASVLYQDLFTFINENGSVFQESPNLYSDNGSPVLMSGTLSWLGLAGLQGYQRAYRVYLLGAYLSPHLLTVSFAYDFNSSAVQADVIPGGSLDRGTYGDDPVYGGSTFYGGANQIYQWRCNLNKQKCQSVQISFQESLDPDSPIFGPGLEISAMGVVAGVKSTYPRLGPNRIITS